MGEVTKATYQAIKIIQRDWRIISLREEALARLIDRAKPSLNPIKRTIEVNNVTKKRGRKAKIKSMEIRLICSICRKEWAGDSLELGFTFEEAKLLKKRKLSYRDICSYCIEKSNRGELN
jgi:hypothetical protein